MALQRVDDFGDGLGRAEVTETPTSHGVGFAESVDRDGEVVGFFGERGHADVRGIIIDELLVDLVGKDENVLGECDFDQRLEFFAGVDRSGRVARAIDDDHLGARGHRVLEFLGGHFVGIRRLGLDDDRLGADEADHVGIAQPVRRGDDDFVAGFAAGEDRVVAGLLGAVADDDLARLVVDVVVGGVFLADRGAQLGQSGARRVFGETFLQRLDRRLFDVLRRIEVGLAGAESADIDALGAHGLGFAVDGEGERGSELNGVGREVHDVVSG